MTTGYHPTPRIVAALLVLAVVGAACDPTTIRPTPTPQPSATSRASQTLAPTPDNESPDVVTRDPQPDGVLPTNGVVRVTFSEPVRGVDLASFQLSDGAGAVLAATISLGAGGRTAVLAPRDGLTIASAYTVTLTAAVRDEAGNPLPRTSWALSSDGHVEFAAGTYNGYRFGPTTADLTGFKRAALGQTSSASATEYRVMDGNGYLMIDAGIWAGYWVPGTATGAAVDDRAAPIPPLPKCAYLDLPATRTSYADWGTTVLDTVFLLPRGYAPRDLVNTLTAGLNGGHLIRSIGVEDLSAMVAAATADGASLAVQSAYRSYAGQVLTFNNWVSQVGYQEALQTSARPGHSEHQLGTAIDFRTVGGASPWTYSDWATTKEGAWLAAHAWRFGWVMSYPKGTSAVSCYRYEPWHYRYVGRERAAAMHTAGVTPREWLWSEGDGVR
ncbi:MAG: D-alanyl-D-alanine carboxypeptidase family protein [Chloroflexota bacterium]|nr:D-alanyl-D-alanine carboxypeptidase family protein [Chloroflexota bacterium]